MSYMSSFRLQTHRHNDTKTQRNKWHNQLLKRHQQTPNPTNHPPTSPQPPNKVLLRFLYLCRCVDVLLGGFHVSFFVICHMSLFVIFHLRNLRHLCWLCCCICRVSFFRCFIMGCCLQPPQNTPNNQRNETKRHTPQQPTTTLRVGGFVVVCLYLCSYVVCKHIITQNEVSDVRDDTKKPLRTFFFFVGGCVVGVCHSLCYYVLSYVFKRHNETWNTQQNNETPHRRKWCKWVQMTTQLTQPTTQKQRCK